ncbi:UDP-2,4-diacetamido-2,4,6-trideoxy-beta-L-altropyranose hydrolase [Oceanobacillus limi]|nr:UDP-2,4-diacetamido-2,4,6-trideoxy-beta-L-altropyranose hydrolase [Oceanobacillus limi]
MKICFRVDASFKMGTGHVMRCLALAEKLKENGHFITFICRAHDGNLCNFIKSKGYIVYKLVTNSNSNKSIGSLKHSEWLGVTQIEDVTQTRQIMTNYNLDFEWIVIDHYAIDKTWEVEIRNHIPNIMVIDDIADREHKCDILLDQNYYHLAGVRYEGLVSKDCIKLLGPKYSLLRDEFVNYHMCPKIPNNRLSIMVFFGGSDPTNETLKALTALLRIIEVIKGDDITIHVVVGQSNLHKNIIKDKCELSSNIIFHCNIDYMAKLMHSVDFAICAGGSTTWERYCVGTPAILTAIAYNQIEICENVQQLGIDQYIGFSDDVSHQTIELEVRNMIDGFSKSQQLRAKAKKIVDGQGKERVVRVLENISNKNKLY